MRLELGAFVLGALPADESALVETHVTACAECRAELAELAPLPGLLRRVPATDVLWWADALHAAFEPVADLVPAVVARADRQLREHRTRTRRRWAVAGVAVALLGGAAVGTSALINRSAVVEAAVAPVVVRANDPATGIRAEVTLRSSSAGTNLALKLSGVPAGEKCLLVAKSGSRRDTTAAWDATYSGEATFTGSTRFAIKEIDTLVIETPSGRPLLTMPVG